MGRLVVVVVVVVFSFIHVNRTYDNIQTSIITCNYEHQSTIQYNSKKYQQSEQTTVTQAPGRAEATEELTQR